MWVGGGWKEEKRGKEEEERESSILGSEHSSFSLEYCSTSCSSSINWSDLVPLNLNSLEVLALVPSQRGGHEVQTSVSRLRYKDESVKGLSIKELKSSKDKACKYNHDASYRV